MAGTVLVWRIVGWQKYLVTYAPSNGDRLAVSPRANDGNPARRRIRRARARERRIWITKAPAAPEHVWTALFDRGVAAIPRHIPGAIIDHSTPASRAVELRISRNRKH